MKTVSASEMKLHLGRYLSEVAREPVLIEKNDRPAAVLLSFEEYARLEALDDAWWAARASEAEAAGYLSAKESETLLTESLRAKG
jgi:prevent-host-death family protein